ncbi:hypothetical protein HDU85_003322 [Gaertneriomyces sp. JEL0708]|nr:hypothetical protein HDU85_003322 [Gaertneriomyces sp. JEL0708]
MSGKTIASFFRMGRKRSASVGAATKSEPRFEEDKSPNWALTPPNRRRVRFSEGDTNTVHVYRSEAVLRKLRWTGRAKEAPCPEILYEYTCTLQFLSNLGPTKIGAGGLTSLRYRPVYIEQIGAIRTRDAIAGSVTATRLVVGQIGQLVLEWFVVGSTEGIHSVILASDTAIKPTTLFAIPLVDIIHAVEGVLDVKYNAMKKNRYHADIEVGLRIRCDVEGRASVVDEGPAADRYCVMLSLDRNVATGPLSHDYIPDEPEDMSSSSVVTVTNATPPLVDSPPLADLPPVMMPTIPPRRSSFPAYAVQSGRRRSVDIVPLPTPQPWD